jgi:hypothetical protein
MWFAIWYTIGLISVAIVCYVDIRITGEMTLSISDICTLLFAGVFGVIVLLFAITYVFEKYGKSPVLTIKMKRKEK